jgi:hypothetical protein
LSSSCYSSIGTSLHILAPEIYIVYFDENYKYRAIIIRAKTHEGRIHILANHPACQAFNVRTEIIKKTTIAYRKKERDGDGLESDKASPNRIKFEKVFNRSKVAPNATANTVAT